MSARLTFVGLAGLRDAFKRLPAELKAEAVTLVRDSATQAQRAIVAQYPAGKTGQLRAQVQVVSIPAATYGTAAAVKSQARYARFFEEGTRVRQTKNGWNRGRMPAANVLVPTMIRVRAALYRDLADVIRRAGFEVRLS
jgi:hypothetical protein